MTAAQGVLCRLLAMLSPARRTRLRVLGERRRHHDEASDRLSTEIREEVLAAVADGALHREVAEALGVTEVRVGQIIRRAEGG